jgi:hypothetical protein
MGMTGTLDLNEIKIADAIYTSNDSGSHWELTSVPIESFWDSVASSSDGTTLVASLRQSPFVVGGNAPSAPGKIYVSRDSGVTWELTSAPTDWQSYWQPVAVSSDGTRVVAGSAGGSVYLGRIPPAPVDVAKAVRLVFGNLLYGANYQLQGSKDLNSWTGFGLPFTATSATISQFVDVVDTWSYFFRLQMR